MSQTVTASDGTQLPTNDLAQVMVYSGSVLQSITVAYAPRNPVFLSGTLTNGSPTIAVASTTGIFVGQQINGTGIPAGATVLSFVSNTSITLSANATMNGAISMSLATIRYIQTLTYTGSNLTGISQWIPAP
jgi:hypothetical protein